MVDGKACGRCKQSRPLEEYIKGKQWRDGLFPYCRGCRKLAQRETYLRHHDRRKAEMREAYRQDPEPARAYMRERYQAKKTEIRAYQLTWEAANRDKQRVIRDRWAKANSDAIAGYNRERRARKLNAPSIPFTPAQLASRMAYFGGRCWVCGVEHDAVDHVKPLSRGGWHCLSNLRPICTPCNTRKKDRWPFTKESSCLTR